MADAAVPAAPPAGSLRHLPALDGLRAVAVGAVLLFHSGFDWAGGGFLGVTVFFVLSGYLIGGILLAEHDRRGGIDLVRFWARRCRRLVPAVLALVLLVAGYLAWGAERPVEGVVGDAVASLAWVANWRFVLDDHSYSELFSAPTPFQHMWSLAIEEQFYLALPAMAALLLGRGGRRRLGWGLVVGIAASTAAAALLHGGGGDAGRAYYGTDARVAEPLIGVLLAVVLVSPAGRRVFDGRARRVVGLMGIAGALGLVALITSLTERSDALYRGGFLLAGVLSAAVVVAATQPATVVARVLSSAPLVAVGRVSYGVYLFHWPLFLWLTPARTGLAPVPLLALRAAATLALAWVSYEVVERPIREGRLPGRLALVGWANVGLAALATVVIVRPVAPALAGFTDAIRPAGPVPTVAPPVGPKVAAAAVPAAPPTTVAPGPVVTAAPSTTSTAAPTERARSLPDVERPPEPAAPPPTTSPSTTTTAPASPSSPPILAGPVRIAVVGDSMASGLAAGLESWARGRTDVVVYDLSTSSCPLSGGGGSRHFPDGSEFGVREECSWWMQPSSDRMRKFRAFDPEVVVAQDAMNEILDRRLPDWSEHRHVGMSSFDGWLTDRYTDMARTLTEEGARLLLLDAACADWWQMGTRFDDFVEGGEGDRRVGSMRRLTGALRVPGVEVVDFFARLCPTGSFTQTVEGVEGARPDGYHLSVDGAAAVAAHWLGPLARRTARPA